LRRCALPVRWVAGVESRFRVCVSDDGGFVSGHQLNSTTNRPAHPQTRHAPGRPGTSGDHLGSTGTRRQALFRDLNEEIRRVSDGFALDEPLELVCECGRGECFARLSVSHQAYEAVRRFPTRFVIRVDHQSTDERVVEETNGYAVVEKVGSGAETAILLDRRNHRAEARS